MCQIDITSHHPEYESICSKGRQIADQCKGEVSLNCNKEVETITKRWVLLTSKITRNQQQLEDSLKEWQQYSIQMENIMVWLKEKEKMLKKPTAATCLEELRREIEALKVRAIFYERTRFFKWSFFLHQTVTTFVISI